jgi:hypothetical protein
VAFPDHPWPLKKAAATFERVGLFALLAPSSSGRSSYCVRGGLDRASCRLSQGNRWEVLLRWWAGLAAGWWGGGALRPSAGTPAANWNPPHTLLALSHSCWP